MIKIEITEPHLLTQKMITELTEFLLKIATVVLETPIAAVVPVAKIPKAKKILPPPPPPSISALPISIAMPTDDIHTLISEKLMSEEITYEQLLEVLSKHGITSLREISLKTDLIPAIKNDLELIS